MTQHVATTLPPLPEYQGSVCAGEIRHVNDRQNKTYRTRLFFNTHNRPSFLLHQSFCMFLHSVGPPPPQPLVVPTSA